MAKTELGCQVLQEKGHFAEFSQFVRQHSHESEDMELLMKLKSILWAVVRLPMLCLFISQVNSFERVMLVLRKAAYLSLRRKKSYLLF